MKDYYNRDMTRQMEELFERVDSLTATVKELRKGNTAQKNGDAKWREV